MKLAHRSQSTLALILGCAALALVAPGCGDDDDSTGANGGTAGKSNSGGKAGATSTGGKSSSGGSTAQGGKTTGSGGKTTGSGGATVIGGAGAGGLPEGGAGAGTGGSTSGGTSSGGTSSGGTGTGGSIWISGGSGGIGGEGGFGGEAGGGAGGGGAGGEGGAPGPVAPLIADTFDTSADGWYPVKYYDTCTTCYNDNSVTLTLNSGVATLGVPFGAEANTGSHTATVGRTLGGPWSNVAGRTFKVKMRWVSGGVGSATNATGGFDVYLIANDADWTEKSARFEFTAWDGDRGATAFKEFAFTIPAASGDFDPATVNRFMIRIDSKYWTNQNDPQPVFDYTPAVFEIDSIVVQ